MENNFYNQEYITMKHILHAIEDPEIARSVVRDVEELVRVSMNFGYQNAIQTLKDKAPLVIDEDLEVEFKPFVPTREEFLNAVCENDKVFHIGMGVGVRIIGIMATSKPFKESTEVMVRTGNGSEYSCTMAALRACHNLDETIDSRNEFIQTVQPGDEIYFSDGKNDESYATVEAVSDPRMFRTEKTQVKIQMQDGDLIITEMKNISPENGLD